MKSETCDTNHGNLLPCVPDGGERPDLADITDLESVLFGLLMLLPTLPSTPLLLVTTPLGFLWAPFYLHSQTVWFTCGKSWAAGAIR